MTNSENLRVILHSVQETGKFEKHQILAVLLVEEFQHIVDDRVLGFSSTDPAQQPLKCCALHCFETCCASAICAGVILAATMSRVFTASSRAA